MTRVPMSEPDANDLLAVADLAIRAALHTCGVSAVSGDRDNVEGWRTSTGTCLCRPPWWLTTGWNLYFPLLSSARILSGATVPGVVMTSAVAHNSQVLCTSAVSTLGLAPD